MIGRASVMVGLLRQRRPQLAAFGVAGGVALLTAGCGGGGSGSNGGGSRATLTIDWPQRARAAGAPESALSAIVLIAPSGGVGGITFTVDRDSSRPEGYSKTYSSPSAVSPGAYDVTVQFTTQAHGGGGVVAAAAKTVNLAAGAMDVGDVAVVGKVASVTVAHGQTLALGKTAGLSFTALDAGGAAIAQVSSGSAFYAVTDRPDLVSVVNGQLKANASASGLASVTVTVDGKTSAPQAVGIGTATVGVSVAGTRGPILVSDSVAGGSAASRWGTTFSFPSAWFASNALSAPAGYGDVRFDHWQQSGQPVSTSPSFLFTPGDGGAPSLTAVYVHRPIPATGTPPDRLQPNYNQIDEAAWDHMPVKVRFAIADTAVVARIRKGFDRWVTATGGVLSYTVVTDPAQAEITVELGSEEASPGEKGLTRISIQTETVNGIVQTPHIVGASIAILTTAPSDPLQNGVDPLEVLAAHEFGHALGITSAVVNGIQTGGHSADPNDTMYPGLNIGTANAVTERDINTLENLYPGRF